ncbi:MAG: hypothetical protein AMXMBFR64_11810 [Myxococcales bacterium]
MDPHLLIRPAEARDVGAVVEVVATVLGEFGLTFGVGSGTDAELLDLPASYTDRGGAFWVVEDTTSGRILGTCGVGLIEEGTLELRKMYLTAETRGRGVGRALLAQAIAFARSAGATRLVLDTTSEMQAAIRLYEAAGFRRDDSQVRGSRCNRAFSLDLGGAVGDAQR